MKAKVLAVLLLLLFAGLTGCMRNTFEYTDRAPGQIIEEGRTFYIAGLIDGNDGPVRAHELCPNGVQAVETIHTVGNMCIGCVTLSIYTPNTVRVTCASGAAHNFYLDENDEVVAHETVDAQTGEVVSRSMRSDIL